MFLYTQPALLKWHRTVISGWTATGPKPKGLARNESSLAMPHDAEIHSDRQRSHIHRCDQVRGYGRVERDLTLEFGWRDPGVCATPEVTEVLNVRYLFYGQQRVIRSSRQRVPWAVPCG